MLASFRIESQSIFLELPEIQRLRKFTRSGDAPPRTWSKADFQGSSEDTFFIH